MPEAHPRFSDGYGPSIGECSFGNDEERLANGSFHCHSAIASISLVATSRLAALHEQAQRGRVPKRVQLNVRIDSALKARFDAVVGAEGLGVGPSAYLEAVLEDVLPESERALEELNRADDEPTTTRLKARKSS